MARINNAKEYQAIMSRIDELFFETDEKTVSNDSRLLELDLLSELVEEYEKEHFPIEKPSLSESMLFRMKELNYSQKELANMLEMTAPRLCEILSGKKFPTYQQARRIANKLNIDPGIVLSL